MYICRVTKIWKTLTTIFISLFCHIRFMPLTTTTARKNKIWAKPEKCLKKQNLSKQLKIQKEGKCVR